MPEQLLSDLRVIEAGHYITVESEMSNKEKNRR